MADSIGPLDTRAAFDAANNRRVALLERQRTKPLSAIERTELADLTTAVDEYMARVHPRQHLHVVVLAPGSPAWWAAHRALDQYVENQADAVALYEDTDESPNATRARAELNDARNLLEHFTAALCALAEAPCG